MKPDQKPATALATRQTQGLLWLLHEGEQAAAPAQRPRAERLCRAIFIPDIAEQEAAPGNCLFSFYFFPSLSLVSDLSPGSQGRGAVLGGEGSVPEPWTLQPPPWGCSWCPAGSRSS